MRQISAKLPDELVVALDEAATKLHRTRADVIRQAVEYYLDDFEDISRAAEALRNPADPVLDWETAKNEYSVSIKQSALKSLKNIAHEDRLRIIEAIDQLKSNPATGGVLTL